MPYTERKAIIERIEALRGSKVITYLTTLRPSVPGQIADDQVRVMFDHIRALPKGIGMIDVFLVTNGGESTVPWRLVALIREYAPKFNVLIPYKAMSAGSIFALGADEIVMHQLGEMGPIDPSVANQFNPTQPQTGQPVPISVEDVKSYISFVQSTAGVTTEEGRIKALELLVANVHPLALGNVERFINQARLVGEKILRTHMDIATDKPQMDSIIENMASKLYFHGHPINRKEARMDLGLSVCETPAPQLEEAMLELYLDYEKEFKMMEPFNPMAGLNTLKAAHLQSIRQAQIDFARISAELQSKQTQAQMTQDPADQARLGAEVQGLYVAQADAQMRANLPMDQSQTHDLVHACIESLSYSDMNVSQRAYTMTTVATPMGNQTVVNEEILRQAWNRYPA